MNAEKWHHSKIRMAISDESQGSVAKNLRCDELLYYTFIINCNTYFRMMPFLCNRISQGSVATCLKRGGIFKHDFVANLLPSRLVKKILKIG